MFFVIVISTQMIGYLPDSNKLYRIMELLFDEDQRKESLSQNLSDISWIYNQQP